MFRSMHHPRRMREGHQRELPMKLETVLAQLNAEFYGPGYAHALDHLTFRGFYLDNRLQWRVPHGFTFADKDRRAVAFLALEWGYSTEVIEDPEEVPPRSRQH
jgi:hypothetical protein